MGCRYEAMCLNGPNGSQECYRCFDQRLLRLPRDRARLQRRKSLSRTQTLGEPRWQQLEQEVARRLNVRLTAREYEARQNPGSGNVWFRPGDVLHDLLQIECKDGYAPDKTGARKSIRFEKEWLDKCQREALLTHKVPVVMFRFQDDDALYACLPFDELLALIQELQFLKEVGRTYGDLP